MPLYEYQCDACGKRFEVIQKFSDSPPDACRLCGNGPVQRQASSPAIQFKGSGFYITDYAQKGRSEGTSGSASGNAASAAGDGKSSEGSSKSSESSSTDSKSSDSKSTETKSTGSTASSTPPTSGTASGPAKA